MYGYVCFNTLFIACTVKSVSTFDAAVQVNYLAVAEGYFWKFNNNYYYGSSALPFTCYIFIVFHIYRLPAWSRCVWRNSAFIEVVRNKPQKLEWPGYGFYIEVPDGALPPGVTASVAIKVILLASLSYLRTANWLVLFIGSHPTIQKNVTASIQHGAVFTSEEQCAEFKFIVAKCSQEVLPYKFKKSGKGLFNTVCCNSGETILIFRAYWSSGHWAALHSWVSCFTSR